MANMKARYPILTASILPFLVFSFTLHSVRTCVLMQQISRNAPSSLPTISCLLIACIVAGLVLPKLLRLFHDGRRRLPSLAGVLSILPLAAIFLAPSLALLFDVDAWFGNQGICLAACVSYGFMITASLMVMFAKVPARQRGMWLGISCGSGVLFGKELSYQFYRHMGMLGLTGQITLATQSVVNFLLSVLVFAALTRAETTRYEPYFNRSPGELAVPAGQKNYLLLAFLALVLMNGFLDVILIPVFTPANFRPWQYLPLAFGLVCPIVGLVVDSAPNFWVPRILIWCGAFFLMAPSLLVLGKDTWVFTALHTAGALGQKLVMVVMAVTLSGLVKSAAAYYAALLFGIRIISLYMQRFLEYFPDLATGIKVLAATTMTGVYFYMLHRTWFVGERRPPPGKPGLAAALRMLGVTLAEPETGKGGMGEGLEPATARAAVGPGGEEEEGTAPAPRAETGRDDPEDPAMNEEDAALTAAAAAWPLDTVDLPLAFTHYLESVALTPREREIAKELLCGRTTRAISQNLGISENTVNYHIKNILDKYKVASRYAFLARFINTRSDV